DAGIELLNSHSWPGNIRELENVIERSILTSNDGLITEKDIQIDRSQNKISDELLAWLPGKTLNDIERNVILEALQYHNGNRTHTARALGISIRTLRNKLAEYRRLGIRGLYV
ncbi:MAG: sigma-54-dependent Fis family transcriptional regulator, partial [Deltaproteobacteria bacterium]|nr:sigma-54-dependent Fis family transcriptional regulator [Deltaproteobacteria bacterium]